MTTSSSNASSDSQFSTSPDGQVPSFQDRRQPIESPIPSGARCPAKEDVNISDPERVLSVAAGLGLATIGLVRGRLSGLLLTAGGAGLLWRGFSGRCQCYAALGINTAARNQATGVPAQHGYKVEKSVVINKPAAELFEYWRNLANLPRVMHHIKRVEPVDHVRSRWAAAGVLGQEVEWYAEIINERQDELIAWRSLPGGDVDTAGSVRFKALNGGTELTVSLKYSPLVGKLGARIASALGADLDEMLEEDLASFKRKMERAAPSDVPLGT